MPLADYKHVRREIAFSGGSFAVRAINLRDVSILVDIHQASIDQIVSSVRSARFLAAFDKDDTAAVDTAGLSVGENLLEIIMEIIRESPVLVANIISMCADEPDETDKAMSLPISVQMEALQSIADLTFTDAAAVKKFQAGVVSLIRGMLPPMTEAPAVAG